MDDNLFISYSRDDQVWTYTLWRALENEYNVWIDQKIRAGVDWWREIVENIEKCTCFIAVLSPKAVESIYCSAELSYAVALNKPIIPLVVKACDYPSVLDQNHVQFEKIALDAPMENNLVRVVSNIGRMQVRVLKGEFPTKTATRPPIPEPKPGNLQSVYEIFALAEEAVVQGDVARSMKLFEQVITANSGEISETARERLSEVRLDQAMDEAYRSIRRLAENAATQRGAIAALQAFVKTYGEKGIQHDKAKSNLVVKYDIEVPQAAPAKKTDTSTAEAVQDVSKAHNAKIQALTLSQVGQIQLDKRNWDAALRTFVEAYAYDPENWLINYYLGELYIIKRDLDQALAHLEKAQTDAHALPEVQAAIGFVWRLKGQASSQEAERAALFAKAEQCYKTALNLDPTIKDLHGESYWAGLGALQRRLGRYRDAIDSYTRAEEVTPDNSYPIVNLAALLYHDGNLDKAKRYYQRTMRFAEDGLLRNPGDKWARADVITCSLIVQNADVATDLLNRMLREGDVSDQPVIESFVSGLNFLRQSPTPPAGIDSLISMATDWLKQIGK